MASFSDIEQDERFVRGFASGANAQIDLRSLGRQYALQFLYQCSAEKLFFFSDSHFRLFRENFCGDAQAEDFAEKIVKLVLEHSDEIDEKLASIAKNWKIERMTVIDRSILRIAAVEILYLGTPYRVAMNEAIELAKEFGTEESGRFVNGLLDRLVKQSLC